MSEDFYLNTNVIQLTDKNINNDTVTSTKTKGKCGFIMIYAPWCPHCQSRKDEWIFMADKFSSSEYKKEKFAICSINLDKNPVLSDKIKVEGVPTIYYFDENGELTQYNGERSINHYLNYVCNTYKKLCSVKLK
jgi:thioredoxin-like negative regulator of GroEL